MTVLKKGMGPMKKKQIVLKNKIETSVPNRKKILVGSANFVLQKCVPNKLFMFVI